MRKLPASLPDNGLLVGWSLEAGRRERGIGFNTTDPATDSPARTLQPILDTGEGHLTTVAPTGAGKGTGCMIPALLRYPGPVVVVDPKGENYAVTAERRRAMGQEVVLFDPFHLTDAEQRHRFNPLDLADPASPNFVEDVSTLAELASKTPGSTGTARDPFWPQMGQILVSAALLDVLTMPDSEQATLPAARALLNQSLQALGQRAEHWQRAEHTELRRMAGLLGNPAPETLGGYWAHAMNQLDFLKGQRVEEHLCASDLDLNQVHSGAPLSIYLVLPPDKLESHAPLLRLWIGTLIGVMTRRERRPEQSTLMLVDEAAQLGELPQLRQAVTLLRGYGVRVWSFWQDLSQLKHLYPNDWETILNNCRIQQYFGTTTARAADAVVDVSGFGPREAVLDLDRDEMVLNVAGDEPVVARKPNYRFDPPFQGLYADNPFYAESGDDEDDQPRTRAVFRRTEAPIRRRGERKASAALARAARMFHPVPRQHWEQLEGDARERALRLAGITDSAVLADDRFVVRRCRLPFYPHYDWYDIVDTRDLPARHAFYLMSEQGARLLRSDITPIRAVNEQSDFELTRSNIGFYVEFVCASIVAPGGRFLVVESVDEIEWTESPEESFLEDLRERVGPPRLSQPPSGHPHKEGHWYVAAEIVYGHDLFTSIFEINGDTGDVEMLEDTPLAQDLPVVGEAERLANIGRFDANGTFEPFDVHVDT